MKIFKKQLTILFLFVSTFSLGQNAELVVDLEPGSENGISEQAKVLGTLDNAIIIGNETEILISDGTSAGTKIIYDLSASEISQGEAYLNSGLYLAENTDLGNSRLIKISPSGEVDIILENEGSTKIHLSYKDKIYFSHVFNFQDFFFSYDPATETVEEIIELNWFMRFGVRDAIVFNDLIYMIVWPKDMDGSHLATYDGSGNIDFLFELFSSNIDQSSSASINMTVAENNLFFWYGDGTNDYTLYVSDGTGLGTQILQTDFERVFGLEQTRAIGVLQNKVLFNATELDGDRYLWSSDGTIAGTFRIEQLDDLGIDPRYFTNFQDKLAFCGYHGSQPFSAPSTSTLQTDGTTAGTVTLLNPDDIIGNAISNGYWLTNHNDSLFMMGRKESWPFDIDLYKSDGTPEGTIKVSTIGEQAGSAISNLTSAGNNLFFFGTTDSLGIELYVYNSIASIDQDGDGFIAEEDCNDLNADVNPSQTEIPYNGLDDDCNVLTLDDDLDQDGFLLEDDCDDSNFAINPNAVEIANNNIDENCDGVILTTSLHDLVNAKVSIYPNPAFEIINIEVSGNIDYKSTLYDKNGKKLFSSSNQSSIAVHHLPFGTYLLEIEDVDTQQSIVEQVVIGK